MTDHPHHFEVEGPGRDYDCTTFCSDHWVEAASAAEDWIIEAADATDPGESVQVTFHNRTGTPENCYACNPSYGECCDD